MWLTTTVTNPSVIALKEFTDNVNLVDGDNDVVHNLGVKARIGEFMKADENIAFAWKLKSGSETTTIVVSVIGAQMDVDVNLIGF